LRPRVEKSRPPGSHRRHGVAPAIERYFERALECLERLGRFVIEDRLWWT
jgi:hypothetical protein